MLRVSTAGSRTCAVRSRPPRRFWAISSLVFAIVCWTGPASARRNGLATPGCEGCHGAIGAQVTVTTDPTLFNPGDDITVSVAIRGTSLTASTGGLYVPGPGIGQMKTISGEDLTLTTPEGVMHSAPKTAQGGVVTFRFGWKAPAQAGGVVFDAYVLAANGDGSSRGDAAGIGQLQTTFGCTGQTFYSDFDGDGFGNKDYPTTVNCTGMPAPVGFAAVLGDCNENNSKIFPGAAEKCNQKDDDCDGIVDEDAVVVEMWPDDDGDGYYGAKTGTPVIGCADMSGYAPEAGDCSARDPKVHPGAEEVCNLIDDNCNGRADERVRPQCGVGFCRAEGFTCKPEECVPNNPTPEKCNLLDDDCDGETDEGSVCPAGQACSVGRCTLPDGSVPASGGSSSSSGGSSSNSGGTFGSGGSGAQPTDPGSGASMNPGTPDPQPTDEGVDEASGCSVVATGRGAPAFALLLAVLAVAGTSKRRRKRSERKVRTNAVG